MQHFPCPWCGERAETEFRYAGDAGTKRPGRAVNDRSWAQYLYFRKNAKGPAKEYWIHTGGCGRWLELHRDTITHQLTGSEPMRP